MQRIPTHAPRVTSGHFSDDSASKNNFNDPVTQAIACADLPADNTM